MWLIDFPTVNVSIYARLTPIVIIKNDYCPYSFRDRNKITRRQ